jgi:ATP-dependent RNA circularization protein (DNA/RNA ligase family)
MLTLHKQLVKNISKKIGLSMDELNKLDPREIATYFEKKDNKKLSFRSEFPFIGRGNVLRDGIVTSTMINKDIDRILGL